MTLYDMQLPNGMLPYAGPPVNFRGNSDTYHLWALIGTCNTVLIGNETAWLPSIWGGFKKGVDQCREAARGGSQREGGAQLVPRRAPHLEPNP